MRKQSAKTKKILAYLDKHPLSAASQVAQKFEVHVSRVYQLRKKLQEEETSAHAAFDANDPGPTPEQEASAQASAALKEAMMSPRQRAAEKREKVLKYFPEVNVDQVLDSRAQDYGAFKDGAQLMQGLKRLMADHAQRHNKTFADDQWEALEMIIHKVGRIVNGNPDKVDHWTDIAGYAKLVADRLEGRVR